MEQQLNSSTGGWIGDDRRCEADFTSVSQTIAKPNVICRATFKGEVQKATFHLLLEYIDDMKLRHWEFEKHERTDLQNGNVVIDYVLVRHGI